MLMRYLIPIFSLKLANPEGSVITGSSSANLNPHCPKLCSIHSIKIQYIYIYIHGIYLKHIKYPTISNPHSQTTNFPEEVSKNFKTWALRRALIDPRMSMQLSQLNHQQRSSRPFDSRLSGTAATKTTGCLLKTMNES